jgi:hypothetical protein
MVQKRQQVKEEFLLCNILNRNIGKRREII